jgi:outer membrane receptor protein involved in Fe transport
VIVPALAALVLCSTAPADIVPAPYREARPPLATDTLRVRVVDSAGRPVENATVTLTELDRRRVVDAEGWAVFPNLPVARYTLEIGRLGYAPDVRGVDLALTREVVVTLSITPLQLEAITVTVTRSGIDPQTSSLPSEELTGEALLRSQQVSLAHTIDGLAGVRTLSTGEQVGKPIIRGLTGPRVLTLDNGLRLEDYSWSDEDGPSIDPLLAKRIEVIRGPASVLYGSDAMGGVINVIPDPVPDARGGRSFVRGSTEIYGGTNNGEFGGPLRVEGASGGFGWRGILIGRTAGNYHTPAGNDSTPTGTLYNTGYYAVNGELAVGLNGNSSNGTLRYEHYGGHFGLLDGPPVPDDDSLGPLRKLGDDRVQLLTNFVLGGLRLETRSQFQRHSLQEVVDQSRVGAEEPTFELKLNTVSTDVLLHHTGRPWLTGTLGVSGMYQSNESEGQFPLVPGATTGAGAIFAFERATTGRWNFLAGIRGDLQQVNADSNTALQRGAESRTLSAVTGNLGAVYQPIPGLSLALNLGRAFRAPTLFELYTNGPHLGEERFEIGLPTAKPEVSFNTDLTARWQRGRVSAQLAGYRNQINNYLYIQPTGGTATVITEEGDTVTLPAYQYVQTSRAVLWGVDFSSEVAATAALSLRGRFDWVLGDNQATNQPLPMIPPVRGDLEAELHTTPGARLGKAYVTAGVELVAKQTRLGPFDTPTDGYALLDLGAGLERALGPRTINFGIRVRNATNATYTDYLSRYKLFAYGQGRNVLLRMGIDF